MEATIRNAAAIYQRTSEAGVSGRDTECAAFSMVNRDLGSCTNGPSRVRALGRNHALWSLLLKDLALAENRLPQDLKTQLIGLAFWSMRYSTLAMSKPLPADPLIEVNQNVVEGLLAQTGPSAHRVVQPLDAALSI